MKKRMSGKDFGIVQIIISNREEQTARNLPNVQEISHFV